MREYKKGGKGHNNQKEVTDNKYDEDEENDEGGRQGRKRTQQSKRRQTWRVMATANITKLKKIIPI